MLPRRLPAGNNKDTHSQRGSVSRQSQHDMARARRGVNTVSPGACALVRNGKKKYIYLLYRTSKAHLCAYLWWWFGCCKVNIMR